MIGEWGATDLAEDQLFLWVIGHNELFTGRDFDAEVWLQYNRARYYDAKVGRWISEDPIGFAAGDYNLSRYIANSVPNATDPTGLFPIGWPVHPSQSGQESGIFSGLVNGIGILSQVNFGMGTNFGLGDGKWSDPIMRGFGSFRYDQRLHTISVSNGIWASDGNTSGPVSEMCQLGAIWESGGGLQHRDWYVFHMGSYAYREKPRRSIVCRTETD